MADESTHRRMQIKVLYSFDNSATVFLSRSKNSYSVEVAQIPIEGSPAGQDVLTLGAFDLKNCVLQIVRSSPENFRLDESDYAVYYKDITEQPDEPFVANGVMSLLLSGLSATLIPGRVCRNLSTSFLFGDKSNSSSSLTLEIRLKLHIIDRAAETPTQNHLSASKNERHAQAQRRRPRQAPPVTSSGGSAGSAMKATRTNSLPIFYHPPNLQIFNIISADKMNSAPKYDSKRISERFKLAPFLQAKIIDRPDQKRRKRNGTATSAATASTTVSTPSARTPVDGPQRAGRSRSMMTGSLTAIFSDSMISSPVPEEPMSEGSDDADYNEVHEAIDEEDEDEEEEDDETQHSSSSPFQGPQPQYRPEQYNVAKPAEMSASIVSTDNNQFHSLPDLEDLDSKKTHTIHSNKLPPNHDLICINKNCSANDSVTWRYFETKFDPSYLNIQKARNFDKSLYDGMFGPLCNACYLFLRNKGFMRPEAVVKKYLQQQRYKRELKMKVASGRSPSVNNSSSPADLSHKFATPTHAPSEINRVIDHQRGLRTSVSGASGKPARPEDFSDLHDFMNQLNNFSEPLTDIDIHLDAVSRDEATPPMVATKSNTRVISLFEEEDDKENCPPPGHNSNLTEFEHMMIKSFEERSSPATHEDWHLLFGEPTPKDNNAMRGMSSRRSPDKAASQKAFALSMPSSPFLDKFELNEEAGTSSPSEKAKRFDTTMSYVNRKSSPRSEIYSHDVKA